MSEGGGWLAILGEADGIRWVLNERKLVFTETQHQRVRLARPDDEVLLYVTRGAFHNPTRDESQLIALGRIKTEVRRLRAPVALAGRDFPFGCTLSIVARLPLREGAPVRPLVPSLGFISNKQWWGHYLRAGPIMLSSTDFTVMKTALLRVAHRKTPS